MKKKSNIKYYIIGVIIALVGFFAYRFSRLVKGTGLTVDEIRKKVIDREEIGIKRWISDTLKAYPDWKTYEEKSAPWEWEWFDYIVKNGRGTVWFNSLSDAEKYNYLKKEVLPEMNENMLLTQLDWDTVLENMKKHREKLEHNYKIGSKNDLLVKEWIVSQF